MKGRETLPVQLSAQWRDLITRAQLKNHRALAPFRPEGPDHLAQGHLARSQSQARSSICAAARALQFIDATKLRPSSGYGRALPGVDPADALPSRDHDSVWYEPTTKRYLLVDEPYERAAESRAGERALWAHRHGFTIVKPSWPGMYNPHGGSRLYLIADSKKGTPLAPIANALAGLPAPLVEETWNTWNGESAPMTPTFQSPGTIALAGRKAVTTAPNTPRRKTGERSAVGYSLALTGPRRRPRRA